LIHKLVLNLPEGIFPVVRCYLIETIGALKRLRTDKNGVVSFEYVLVAACVVTGVGAGFGSNAKASISTALTNVLNLVSTAISTALGV
jgi:pilus assembly protein Flp/PilA